MENLVHTQLRAYLRSQGLSHQPDECWPHHLTLARLVARALRLGRSALIQVGTAGDFPDLEAQSYRLSYLMALLLWPGAAIVVAAEPTLEYLLTQVIPHLQQWLDSHKAVYREEDMPWSSVTDQGFQGLWVMSPQRWLSHRLRSLDSGEPAIPTLIEAVDDLEDWLLVQQTLSISSRHWNQLKLCYPQHCQPIQDTQIYLTHCFFQHPPNPYDAYLLSPTEQDRLGLLLQTLEEEGWQPQLPDPWAQFLAGRSAGADVAFWVSLDRRGGTFQLYQTPLNLLPLLKRLWSHQSVVLLRETHEAKSSSGGGRSLDCAHRLGLENATQVQFFPHPQRESIQLYLPDRLPLPNTPHYQESALREIRRLLIFSTDRPGLTVILIQDTPLRQQISAILAAEFGSRVQVDRLEVDPHRILVASWDFWLTHRYHFPTPTLLMMTTLPFPSVEHPLVAARVAYYKHHRQDWFQNFLLPQALRDLQRAVAPLRLHRHSSLLAILDTRILYRSYGKQILSVLSPCTRLNYLDPWG